MEISSSCHHSDTATTTNSDRISNAVFTLDVSGKLCDKINIDTDSGVQDCTMVDGKLWVGCLWGDTVVLSPQ